MPRKPRKNYKQTNGRPHDALHNYDKYGLTYKQAVCILNSGRWKAFYAQWKYEQRKLRNIELLDFICPECYEYKKDQKHWAPDGKCCKSCHKSQVKTLRCKGCNDRPGAFNFKGELLCERCCKILKQLIKLSEQN